MMTQPDRHPEEAAFLTALAAQPNDYATRLVFADWLEERGDPRATWVRDADIFRWTGDNLSDPVPTLIAQLGKQRTRGEVTNALSRLGEPALRALIVAFRQGDEPVREHAREVLAQFGPAAAKLLPVFGAEARSDDPQVQRRGVESLGRLKETASAEVPLLISLLAARDYDVFLATISALAQIGPGPAVEALMRFAARNPPPVSDADDSERQLKQTVLILNAFGAAGTDALRASHLLLGCLSYPNDQILTAASNALAKMGERVVEPVLRTLAHMHSDTAHHGIRIITRLKEKAVPALLAALADTGNPYCRRAALTVLADADWDINLPGLAEAVVPLLAQIRKTCTEPDLSLVCSVLERVGD